MAGKIIGNFRDSIIFQELALLDQPTAIGGQIEGYKDFTTAIPAQKAAVTLSKSGNEADISNVLQGVLYYTFVVRYSSVTASIDTTHRIRDARNSALIFEVINYSVDQYQRYITFMTKRIDNTDAYRGSNV